MYNAVGGLRTATRPGVRSALRNAAVTSRKASVLSLEEPGQDESQHTGVQICGGDLSICVSCLVATGHNTDLVFFWFDGEVYLCWQLDVILPPKLSLLLESCFLFSPGVTKQ